MAEDLEEAALRVQDLTRSDRLAEADQLLSAIPRGSAFSGWSHERAIAVVQLAERYAQLQRRQDAFRLVHEALEDVMKLERGGSTWEPVECLLSITRVCFLLGSEADALAAADQARLVASRYEGEDIDCAKLLVSLTELLGENGAVDKAYDVALSIRLECYRSSALSKVSRYRKE